MITATTLKRLVNEPETHRKIVGDYEGGYALGVQESPPAFVLRVEPQDISAFPTRIMLEGESVPVKVQGSFGAVKPLSARL